MSTFPTRGEKKEFLMLPNYLFIQSFFSIRRSLKIYISILKCWTLIDSSARRATNVMAQKAEKCLFKDFMAGWKLPKKYRHINWNGNCARQTSDYFFSLIKFKQSFTIVKQIKHFILVANWDNSHVNGKKKKKKGVPINLNLS